MLPTAPRSTEQRQHCDALLRSMWERALIYQSDVRCINHTSSLKAAFLEVQECST